MIVGAVRSGEGRIRLTVVGPEGQADIEAVIDTGYTAYLTLPPAMVAALGLRWKTADRAILADGTPCLVGMRLLRGYEMKIQVRFRGKVTIKRL